MAHEWQDLPFADPLQVATMLEEIAARLREGSHLVQATWALEHGDGATTAPRHLQEGCAVAMTLHVAPVGATPPSSQ